jgi:hypothetical protein
MLEATFVTELALFRRELWAESPTCAQSLCVLRPPERTVRVLAAAFLLLPSLFLVVAVLIG